MDIQSYLTTFLGFINGSVVPFVLALAFLFFMVNMLRYFIIGGANEDAQTKAKSLAVWGILAFVVIFSLWGIVNIILNVFGITGGTYITPDYMGKKP